MNIKQENLTKKLPSFKQTKAGYIPKNWNVIQLGDILKEVNIKKRDLQTDYQQIPILSMTRHNGLILQSEKFSKRVASKNVDNYKVVRKNNVVYSFPMDEGVIYVLKKYNNGLVSPAYLVWEVTEDNIDVNFLDIILRTPRLISIYSRLSSRTVDRRRIVNKRDFIKIRIPFPPLVEQRGIVEVLGTVDECISLTEAGIERAEELKRGIMQQLFTRGIGHTEYKDTPLGTIPKTWDLVKLGKVILDSQYGTSEKNNDEQMGYPTFRIPNVIGGKIYLNDIKYVQIQPDEAEKYFLQKGDLLVVRTNANPDYIGRCASYNEELNPSIYASYLIRLKLNHENTNYDYVKYYLNSYQGRKQIRKIARTSAGNYNINVPNLKSVKINLPPKDEQNNIVSIIKQTEQNIDTEITKKNYYIKIKEGLMQSLLSGKIRVELKRDGIHRIGDGREANN